MAAPDAVWIMVQERALSETRIRRIARKMQLSTYDVLGRCVAMWFLCYRSSSEYVDPIDVDIATGELPGFVDALVSEEMVDRIDDRTLRVRGAQKAVEKLLKYSEVQSAKGVKSGESRRKNGSRSLLASSRSPTAVQPGLNPGSTAVRQRSFDDLNVGISNGDPGYEHTLSNSYDSHSSTKTVPDDYAAEPRFNPGSTPVQQVLNPGRTPVEHLLNQEDLQIKEKIQDLKSPEDHIPNFALGSAQAISILNPPSQSAEPPNVEPAPANGQSDGFERTRDDTPTVAYHLAALLVAEITCNHPHNRLAKINDASRAKIVTRWAESDLRKLNSVDRMDWTDIEATIRWCSKHSFWSTVVLSADSLRSHWDQITAQRLRGAGAGNGARKPPNQRPGPTELARLETEELERKAKVP